MYVMHGMHNMHACLRGPGFDVCRPSADTGNLHTNLYLSISAPTCARVNLLWCARALKMRVQMRARVSMRARARARVCVCVCVLVRVSVRICPRACARVPVCVPKTTPAFPRIPAEQKIMQFTGRDGSKDKKNKQTKKWRAAPGAKIALRVPKRNFQKLAVPGRHEPGEDNCTG